MEASAQIVARLSEEQIKKVKDKQISDLNGLIKLLQLIPKKDLLKLRRINLLFNLAVLMIYDWGNVILNNIRETKGLVSSDKFNLFRLNESQYNNLSVQQRGCRFIGGIQNDKINQNLSYYAYFRDNFSNVTDLEMKLSIKKTKASMSSLFSKILVTGSKTNEDEVRVCLDALVVAASRGYSNILSKFGVDGFTKLVNYLRDDDYISSRYLSFEYTSIDNNILLAATKSGNPACLVYICSCLNNYFKNHDGSHLEKYIIQAYQYALKHALAEMIEIFLKNSPDLFNVPDFLSVLEHEKHQKLAEQMINIALVYIKDRNIFSETINYIYEHDKDKGAIFFLDNFKDKINYYYSLFFSIQNSKSKIREALFKHPKCLELSEEQITNLLVLSIQMKDIISIRFLLTRCKCNLDTIYQQQTFIELAVIKSTLDIVIQLIVSGATYDLAKLLCLLAQNSDQDQAISKTIYAKALHLIQYRGELITKSQNDEKSALSEAVKHNNLTLINLFTSYKRKYNKISLEEATLALDLAKEYAKDLFSPNINRYNLMVIKLTEFVKRLQYKLQASPLLPTEKQIAPINTAPHASFHQPKSDDRQILQKPAAATLSITPYYPQP